MKSWHIAHIFTILSLLMAILSTFLISPYSIVGLVSTVLIFMTAEKIRRKEKYSEELRE